MVNVEVKRDLIKSMSIIADAHLHSIFTNKCLLVFDDVKDKVIIFNHDWKEINEFLVETELDKCRDCIKDLISKTREDILNGKLTSVSPVIKLDDLRCNVIKLLTNGERLPYNSVDPLYFSFNHTSINDLIPHIVRAYKRIKDKLGSAA